MVPLPSANLSKRPAPPVGLRLWRTVCRAASVVLFAVAAFWGPGCGKPQETAPPGSSIRQIDVATLPALGQYEPPLDGGRIEIAAPAGWRVAPRYGDYVIRFQADAGQQYPMILVTAEDFAGQELTLDTVGDFARQAAPSGAKPIAIGNRLGALYLKHGKASGSIDQILERLLWTGVLSGRRYTLELRTRQGEIPQYENALLAVAAGVRPLGSSEPAGGETGEGGIQAKGEDPGKKPAASAAEKKPLEQKDPGLQELEKLFKQD